MLAVDMHSHLIPGVDDGAQDMEDAITGIQKIYDLGFDKVITTPHIMPGYYNNTADILRRAYEEVCLELSKRKLDVEFAVAAEYYCDEDFHKTVQHQEMLTMGDNYLLFELPFFNQPGNFNEAVFAMQSKGYRPILAHIERYGFFLEKEIEDFAEMRENGLFIQVNIGSFSGAYGPAVKAMAENLAKEKQIDFLGTDYHHAKHVQMISTALQNPLLQTLLESADLKNKNLL